jgi:hypothetical protein
MNRIKKVAAVAAAAAVVAAIPAGTAGAKITCTNPCGNAPAGPQGQSKRQAHENLNPAGHAPPGQND